MERAALQLLTLMMVLFATSLQAEEAWQVARDEQGIVVSTRKVEGSAIAESRAVVQLSGVTLAQVVEVIRDVPHQSAWVDSVDESRILTTLSPDERINYTLSKAPWPVADRDAVVHSKVSHDPASGAVYIESHAEPDYIPEKKGIVRVRKVDSSWRITPQADGHIEVTYQVHSEPGGHLPAWLINSVVYEQPFKTLRNLRERLQQQAMSSTGDKQKAQ